MRSEKCGLDSASRGRGGGPDKKTPNRSFDGPRHHLLLLEASSLLKCNMYEATEPDARAGAEDPGSTHAFRIAEKSFQRRVTKSSKKTGKGKLVEEVVDLSDVVDPSCATFDEDGLHRSENWGEVRRCRRRAAGLDAVVHSFERHPGFFVVTQAMEDAFASRLAELCFGDDVLRPPATTNFTRSHNLSMSGLWHAATNDFRLVVSPKETTTTTASSSSMTTAAGDTPAVTRWSADGTGPAAAEFLRSLRWLSIGPCYDWTKRIYLKEDAHVPLPDDMKTFAQRVWALVGNDRAFDPNAALINYYREGDKLCGHQDDAEIDQTKPLVSISLGCPAVFLMGGEHKNVVPTPILLRHGDVAVLSGSARRAFHGLPRIFPADRKHTLVDRHGMPIDYDHHDHGTDPPGCVRYGQEHAAARQCHEQEREHHPSPQEVSQYLLNCRVNVSIRQV